MGASRSMMRAVMLPASLVSRVRRSSGNSGVRSSNRRRSGEAAGSAPLTASICRRAGFFSLRDAARLLPVTRSPLRSPNWRTCLTDTYTSAVVGR
jgi:hypothetical protein